MREPVTEFRAVIANDTPYARYPASTRRASRTNDSNEGQRNVCEMALLKSAIPGRQSMPTVQSPNRKWSIFVAGSVSTNMRAR